MRIYVTSSDIRNGEKLNASACPIALAIRRRFPNSYVWVGEKKAGWAQKIVIWDGMRSYRFWFSEKILDFVDNFDRCGPAGVKPFSFDLARLEPVRLYYPDPDPYEDWVAAD